MFLKFFRKKTGKGKEEAPPQAGPDHGIDPEMYYCSSCGAEYRLDLPACVTCLIPLTKGSEKLAQVVREQELRAGRRELAPDEKLVSLRKGPLPDMKYLQKILAKDAIPALVVGDPGGCARGCKGPELYLQIREEDVEAALAILAKDFVRTTALDSDDLRHAHAVFDPHAAETVCPACGCTFSPSIGACPECGLSFD
jgi:hypothetical protein